MKNGRTLGNDSVTKQMVTFDGIFNIKVLLGSQIPKILQKILIKEKQLPMYKFVLLSIQTSSETYNKYIREQITS